MTDRQLLPLKILQGVDERISRSVTVTSWGSTPTAVTVVAWDVTVTPWTNVSSTILTGAASVAGDVITTPLIGGMTAGKTYRIEITFTVASGNTFQPFFIIMAEE